MKVQYYPEYVFGDEVGCFNKYFDTPEEAMKYGQENRSIIVGDKVKSFTGYVFQLWVEDPVDIEAEGFVFKYKRDDHIAYTKGDVDVLFHKNGKIMICKGDGDWDDWDTLFYGEIKTHTDFQKVLKQVL
jgi:hypothetical protein